MNSKKKIALVVVLLYCLTLPGAGYLAWQFMHNTLDKYAPPKGTLAHRGISIAERYFPQKLSVNPLFLLVTSHNTSQSILEDPHLEAFSHYLLQEIANKSSPIYGIVNDVLGYYLIPKASSTRASFIGGDHNQLSLLQLGVVPSLKTTVALPTIRSVIDVWCAQNKVKFTREYTSTDLVLGDASSGILEDLMRVDVISLPLAFLVLVICVGSVKLLLVPALSLPCTVTIAFSIMYPVSFIVEVSSFAPELALGVTAAISIDYSLFILTRFREQVAQQEILLGCSPETEWVVVKKTTVMSSENIILSGLTITVAVGSLSFVPVTFISSIGMTMSVSIVCAIVVSLTAQPALLLLFYNFFARSPTWKELWDTLRGCCYRCCCCCRRCICGDQRGASPEAASNLSLPVIVPTNTNSSESNNVSLSGLFRDGEPFTDGPSPTSFEAVELKRQTSSLWFHIGVFSVRHPVISIVCALLFGVPFFYFASELRVDFDMFTQIPRGSPHGNILQRIQTDIGKGSAIPFYLLFSVRDSYTLTFWNSNEMANVMRSTIEAIVARTGEGYASITSPNMLILPGMDSVIWLGSIESSALYLLNEDYRYLVDRTVSPDGKAAYMLVDPPVDPFGALANDYLNNIRDILEQNAGSNIFLDYGITGASSNSWGILKKSMELFPLQIGITLGGMFLFLLIVMRSVFLPLRMIFTIAYTIAFSYGVGVIVFQYKWLHPIWGALDHVESFCFLVPIFAFLLLSALALDYDVFLMTRVVEIKKKGYTNEAAITKAVWKTGRIISFAGVIMFVTIGAMVFSSVMMLAQFAVICGAAVLLDTFVIRPFFSPALMSIVPDSFLWWPRRFPELGRSVDDMRLVLDTAAANDSEEEGTSR